MFKDQAGTYPLGLGTPQVGGMTRCETRVTHFGVNLLTRGFWQMLATVGAVISLRHDCVMCFKVIGERDGIRKENSGSLHNV